MEILFLNTFKLENIMLTKSSRGKKSYDGINSYENT